MRTSATTEAWARRVRAWRASGESAEAFSRREGYAASRLRWWASQLKPETEAAPAIRLARVIRSEALSTDTDSAAPIVIEVMDGRARIAVAPGADRATLAMVVQVLGVGASR